MKKEKTGILVFFKPFLFSAAITTGIFIALQELHRLNNSNNFIIFSVIIGFIYLIEIYISYQNKSPRLELNLDLKDEINEFSEFIHKIVLPIALYIATVLFGKFNYNSAFLPFYLCFIFIIFFILFTNITYFFEHKLTQESKTHYVYDIIKFLIFFSISNVLINLFFIYPQYAILWGVLEGLLTFFIIILMVWRINLLGFKTIVLTWATALATSGVLLFLGSTEAFSINESTLILLFIFYFAVAIIHHYLMRSLSTKIVLEYLSVIALLMAVTYGIR